MPGSFGDDVESTASIKSGVPGASQSGSALTHTPDINKTLPTEKPLPSEPGVSSTDYGRGTSTGAGGIESNVERELHGSRGVGSNTGTGSGLTGSSLPDRSVE